MDIYQIMARLNAISAKETLTESQHMADPVAEGQVKRDLERRAEQMNKAAFVANAGEYGMSSEEAAEFWTAVNGNEEVDEAYDKLPADQMGLDKFSQAALTGGQRKRDALANPDRARMLAKKSAQRQQPVKEVITTTVKKGDRVSVEGKPAVVVGQMKTPVGAAKYFAVRFDGKQYPGNTYDQAHANRLFPMSQVDEDEVEEGNEFSGELAKAKSVGAKEFEVDGKSYPVKEAKKAKPDFLDMDRDGNKKEPMKKAVADKEKGTVKESEQNMSRAAKGYEKYGKQGMQALAKAGREGKSLDPIRKKYNKYDESAKPDFLDLDKDGNKKEPMKKAARDKNDARGSFQKQMGGSAGDLTKGLSIGAKKVNEADKKLFPGTPEYELRFGKDDASSAFDKKKISTGTVYTRKHQEEPEAADDDTPKKKGRPVGAKRALGAKGPGVNSKLLKGKGGLKEDDIDIRDRGEYDREGDMALNQVHQIADAAEELHSILDANENLPEWVQSKITKAVDYLDTARDYLKAKDEQHTHRGQESMSEYSFKKTDKKDRKEPTLNLPKTINTPVMRSKNANDEQSISSQASISRKRNYMEEPVAEEAAKKDVPFDGPYRKKGDDKDQFGNVIKNAARHAAKKGLSDMTTAELKSELKRRDKVEEESTGTSDQHAERAGKRVTRDLEYDMKHKGKDDAKAEKAGKKVTRDIEYDDKKDKKKEVEETTVSGSVATGGDAPAKKSKGGMQFGKGVYEGVLAENFAKKMQQLNEGYSVNVTVDDGGRKNITVTASDEQADQLGQMLKMAGLFSSEGYSQVCNQCSGIHEAGACGVAQVDEELANAPDQVYADTDYMTKTLAGGLNGPKTTGQTTGAVVNRQDSRQGVMAEAEQVVEQAESRLWNLYRKI